MTDPVDKEVTRIDMWDRHTMTDQVDKDVTSLEMWDIHIDDRSS